MARILSISYDHRLLRTRELLLQRMGHSVTSVAEFAQAVELCNQGPAVLDLVVVGHSIPHEDKHALVSHCNQTCRCPVLALTLVNEPPVTEAARSIDPSDTGAFVAAVNELLQQDRADQSQQ